MSTERDNAFSAINESVQRKLERAFWELDDVIVALAPDAPSEAAEAWSALHSLMTPEFIKRRDKIRGLTD